MNGVETPIEVPVIEEEPESGVVEFSNSSESSESEEVDVVE